MLQENQAALDCRGYQVVRENEATMEDLVKKEIKVNQDHQVLVDKQEGMDLLDLLELQDKKGKKEKECGYPLI